MNNYFIERIYDPGEGGMHGYGKSFIFCLFMALSLSTCSEDYVEVTFKVVCTGAIYPGEFTGYYSVDGGDEHAFGSIEQIDSYTYTYTSGSFENFDILEI